VNRIRPVSGRNAGADQADASVVGEGADVIATVGATVAVAAAVVGAEVGTGGGDTLGAWLPQPARTIESTKTERRDAGRMG